jgi:hypothetical protein
MPAICWTWYFMKAQRYGVKDFFVPRQQELNYFGEE